MSYADAVSRGAYRVVWVQALATVAIAIAFGLFAGAPQALAALYGGTVTAALTAWLAWRVRRAGSLAAIYSGALARYALAAAAIGVGIGPLKLSALPLLCAFAVTQFGFLALLRRP
jgi:hypothetical protein